MNLSDYPIDRGRYLIEASAGTGKTYTITHLILRLILKGVPVRRILVTTFSKAAADELKKRAKAESRWNGYRDNKGEVEKFGDFFGFELPFGDAFRMLAEAFFGAVIFRPENSAGKRQRKQK